MAWGEERVAKHVRVLEKDDHELYIETRNFYSANRSGPMFRCSEPLPGSHYWGSGIFACVMERAGRHSAPLRADGAERRLHEQGDEADMIEQAVMFDATVEFGGFRCEVHALSYASGGGTALCLIDGRDGGRVAVATVNVEGVSELLPANEILIKDYSENAGMLAVLEEAGIVEDTGRAVRTGYAEAPIARLLESP